MPSLYYMAALLVCRLPLEASIRYVECCLRDKVRERDDNVTLMLLS